MRNVKMVVSYDGTDFHGFQAQKSGIPTIGGELEKAVNLLSDNNVEIVCAGRTDKGVHAEGQVINFLTSRVTIKEHNWIRAVNSSLPPAIRITDCEFVNDEFSARFDAKAREYWYHISNVYFPDALTARFSTHVREPLDIELLNKYCGQFVGEYDFTSFCSTLDSSSTKVRRIESFTAEKCSDLVILKIKGSAFLHNMVRIITGTVLTLHKQGKKPEIIKDIIEAKDRTLAGNTMPPTGLVFKKVYY